MATYELFNTYTSRQVARALFISYHLHLQADPMRLRQSLTTHFPVVENDSQRELLFH
jgi:hypothetical protein